MSKKYVIEIMNTTQRVMQIGADKGEVLTYTLATDELDEFTVDYIQRNCKSLLDAFYQKGFEDGKAFNDKGCEGCKYSGTPQGDSPCFNCSNYYTNNWTAKQTDDKSIDIIRNGIHNWVTELNVKLDDIALILEAMKHD